MVRKLHPCNHCATKTRNRKFCSRSCLASSSNTARLAKENSHCICGNEIQRRTKYCPDCRPRTFVNENTTIQDIKNRAKYQVSAFIRYLARKTYNGPKSCYVCGYSKHIEVCHIKAIESFPPETKIMVINNQYNLIGLCRNHHWEFDKNLLDITLHGQLITNIKKTKPLNKCLNCGDACRYKYCSQQCSHIKQERIAWPVNLIALVNSTNLSAVARDLGISVNSIKNRLKNHAVKC